MYETETRPVTYDLGAQTMSFKSEAVTEHSEFCDIAQLKETGLNECTDMCSVDKEIQWKRFLERGLMKQAGGPIRWRKFFVEEAKGEGNDVTSYKVAKWWRVWLFNLG